MTKKPQRDEKTGNKLALEAEGGPTSKGGKATVFDAIQLETTNPEAGTTLFSATGGLVKVEEPIAFKTADSSLIQVGDSASIGPVNYKVEHVSEAGVRYTFSDGDGGLQEAVYKTYTLTLEDSDGNTISYFIMPDSQGNVVDITQVEVLITGEEAAIQINDVSKNNKVTIAAASDEVIYGTSGNDVIDVSYTGDPDGDMVDANDNSAGNNDDFIKAGNGSDVVISGHGDDTVYGGKGNDEIYAQDGNDILYGDDGRDLLFGVHGDDELNGGNGNDYLSGGYDNDILTGGKGADVFVFDGDFDSDVVTDFSGKEGDRVEFVFYTPEKENWDAADILSFASMDGGNLIIDIPGTDEIVKFIDTNISDLTESMIDISFLG